ncbi:MAG: sigma-70 family RNA polymerase sigma factor [Planctomycetota bacterium]
MSSFHDSMLRGDGRFATTRWSLVLGAGVGDREAPAEESGADAARQALEELCATYWPAVYAWIRRRGYRRDEARDLAQGFFTSLVEKGWVERADEERGSFRTFLVTLLKRFVAGEWQRESTLRRGGGEQHVPLDFDQGGMEPEVGEAGSPEAAFDLEWIRSLLSCVLERLSAEYARTNATERFQVIEPHLVPGDTPPPFREMASKLGLAESSCRVAVFRARRRYRELLRDELASTLSDGRCVDEELEALLGVSAGGAAGDGQIRDSSETPESAL